MRYFLSWKFTQSQTGCKHPFAGKSNLFPLKLSSDRFLRLEVSTLDSDVVSRIGSLAWAHAPTTLIPLYCHQHRLVCIFCLISVTDNKLYSF
jgi:hypothetical protein